jgi:hypothetical protein
MMRKRTLIFAGLFLCALAAGIGYYLYNKPRAAAFEADTDKQVTAERLYQEFMINEAQAESIYVNKVLEITGTVKDVQHSGQEVSVLLSGGEDKDGGVNCSVTGTGKTVPKVGEAIKVKGVCTGLLMDVSISDATIIVNK